MSTYIALVNWTDQGIKAVKDSPKQLDAAREMARRYGCEIGDAYLTIGAHDMVVKIEAPDDEAAAKVMLSLGAGGNIRTTTLKAFPEEGYRRIIGSL